MTSLRLPLRHLAIGAAVGALAMTGTSIALLVAMILALLAAGAYLVRESYRRNHSVGTE